MLPKKELSIEVGQVYGVHVDDYDFPEARERLQTLMLFGTFVTTYQIFENLASQSASTNHKNSALLDGLEVLNQALPLSVERTSDYLDSLFEGGMSKLGRPVGEPSNVLPTLSVVFIYRDAHSSLNRTVSR